VRSGVYEDGTVQIYQIRGIEEGTIPIEPYRRPQPSLRSLLRKEW